MLAVVFVGYLIFGISENMKGPALPRMQEDFRLEEWQLGLLLAFNSLGFLLACSFAGRVVQTIGLRTACLLTFGFMAASGWLIGSAQGFVPFAGAFFFFYVWNGLLEIALAVLSARLFTKNTGFMMNLSHFFYGLSSTGAPLAATGMMAWSVGGEALGWRGMYTVLLLTCALPMLPALLAKFPKESAAQAEARVTWRSFMRDKVAWCVVVLLAFGVTAELAVGGWLVNFLEKSYGWDTVRASGMLSAFFFCFTIARLVLGPLTDRFGFVKSIVLFAGFSGACTCAGILLGEPGAALLALAGAGIAPVYPTVMAFLAKRYPHGTDAAITFTVTTIGILGIVGNFLIGAATDALGYRAGYSLIGLSALGCAAAGVVLYRWLHKEGRVI
ncbi:MFS transporter [Paenibacillus antri]|uniref:MFS transporter n=1 Tax=Paenibacillus antri TaxID=2582848 RepID=UPI001EE43DBA|nr:MFS transporter [Paenibacillus antri]